MRLFSDLAFARAPRGIGAALTLVRCLLPGVLAATMVSASVAQAQQDAAHLTISAGPATASDKIDVNHGVGVYAGVFVGPWAVPALHADVRLEGGYLSAPNDEPSETRALSVYHADATVLFAPFVDWGSQSRMIRSSAYFLMGIGAYHSNIQPNYGAVANRIVPGNQDIRAGFTAGFGMWLDRGRFDDVEARFHIVPDATRTEMLTLTLGYRL